jgi:hypothetical protein
MQTVPDQDSVGRQESAEFSELRSAAAMVRGGGCGVVGDVLTAVAAAAAAPVDCEWNE